MGELICSYCKATQEADTFEQADDLIDHSHGRTRGKPCTGSQLDMTWDGKPVASVVIHFGPGSNISKHPGARKERPSESSIKEHSETSEAQSSPKTKSKSSTKQAK